MKYEMKVVIYNPETPKGMLSDIMFNLSCVFAYDPEQYGNGHYVSISGKEFYRQVIDLRYDTEFDRNNKTAFLERWARKYWSGKDGAYAVKTLEIFKKENDYESN